jgi:hypothetical protein
MAKEQLNGPQVGACFEEVNREGMAERMRADGFGNSGAKARLSAGMLNGVRGDRLVEIPGKEPLLWSYDPPIVTQRIEQLRREHDVAILAALALGHPVTIRWLSSEVVFRRTASEMRKPAA